MNLKLVMLLVLFIPTWSKLSANDLNLGANLQLGYIPVEASPLKKGSYNYYGIYIGTNSKKVGYGIMQDQNSCNQDIQRISYSQHINTAKSGFLWGVEYLNIDRNFQDNCNIGAIISIPLPYFGYRYEFLDNKMTIDLEFLVHINRAGTSINIGF